MKKGERTKSQMIATTAALLQRQGFHATGLSQILKQSGAPKGSLYFHFPGGKEDLACTALDQAGAEWRQRLELAINAISDPGDAVMVACQTLGRLLAESDYTNGCPLATVALEAAATSEPVRETCARHYAGWEELISERIASAGVSPDEAERFATFVLSAIEGALLLARVYRSTEPLDRAGEMLRNMLALHRSAKDPPGSAES